MTYVEIQQLQKKISALKIKIELIRAEGEKITPNFTPTPNGTGTSDKVGDTATQICILENEINEIKAAIDTAIQSLPDTFIGNCIRLRVKRHYSWRKLSFIIGGNNSAESIKKMCYRYRW